MLTIERRVLDIVCSFSSILTLLYFPLHCCSRRSTSYISQTSSSWNCLVLRLRGTTGILEGEREKAFFLYLPVESTATAVMVAEATVGAVGARVAAPARCQLWLGSAGQLASDQGGLLQHDSLSGIVPVGSE